MLLFRRCAPSLFVPLPVRSRPARSVELPGIVDGCDEKLTLCAETLTRQFSVCEAAIPLRSSEPLFGVELNEAGGSVSRMEVELPGRQTKKWCKVK